MLSYPTTWPVRPLGELCRQLRGITYRREDARSEAGPGFLPVLRANNIDAGDLVFTDFVYVPQDLVKRVQRIRKGDVVIAASSGSLNVVGKAAQAASDWKGSFGAFCKLLRPTPGIVASKFFGYFFQTTFYRFTISRLAAGANINNLRNEHLDEMPFPSPPLPEQERLGSILDEADGIRRKRRQAIETANDLAPSIFREMFGSLADKARQWPVAQVGDFCADIDTLDPTKTPNQEFTYVDIASINTNEGRIESPRTLIGADAPSRARQKVMANDILISTVRPNLRQTALVPEECDGEVCSTGFAVLRPDAEKLEPLYLFSIARNMWFTNTLISMTTGASYPAVRHRDVLAIRIPVPPIALQRQFAERVRAIHGLQERMRLAATESNNLFNSLTQRAFKGEL